VISLLNSAADVIATGPASANAAEVDTTMMEIPSILNPVEAMDISSTTRVEMVLLYRDSRSDAPGYDVIEEPLESGEEELRESQTSSATSPAPSSRKKRKSTCNKRYTLEEVDFLQYHKIDRKVAWKECLELYGKRFVGSTPRESDDCLNSRWYREQFYPDLDEEDNLILGLNGRPRMLKLYNRGLCTRWGKQLERLGYLSFLRSHPRRALERDWVLPEDKVVAWNCLKERNYQPLPGIDAAKKLNE